jgi:prevent-host-death family protein
MGAMTLPPLPTAASRPGVGPARPMLPILTRMIYVTRIAVAEAKARLSELLDRASRGERFLVVRHGRPMAALVPVGEASPPRRAPAGLAAVAGALADWTELDAVVEDISAARARAKDRPAPSFD